MAIPFVLLLVCLASSYSEAIVLKNEPMAKEMMPEKMQEDPVMVESAMAKPKRDSYPYHHSTPCPPWLAPHVHKGWNQPNHVQFIHQPTVIQKPVIPIVKPHYQSGWNSGWSNPGWNQGWNSGWSKPSHGWGNPGWNQGWNSGWSKPSHGWQQPQVIVTKPSQGWNSGWSNPGWNPGWNSGWSKPSHGWHQPQVVVSKPSWPSSYAPQYHKPVWQAPQLIKPAVIVKPDCPPWQHSHHDPHHGHTGVVYAPQHQSYHEPHIKYLHNEPQYVKVVKPAYHHPQPIIPWQPPVHHIPKVELCD